MRRQNSLIIALSIAVAVVIVASLATFRQGTSPSTPTTPSASAVQPLAGNAGTSPESVPSAAPVKASDSKIAPDPVYGLLILNRLVPLKDNVAWDPSWPRYPYRNVPRHPLNILASSSRPEPELKAWLEHWQEVTWTGGSVTPANREQLATLLAASGLPALAMLEAGQSFDLAEDEATAAIWFRHGVMQGEKELADIPEMDVRGRRLAEMLLVVQGLMWPAQNNALISEGPTFEMLYHCLVAVLPEDDDQRNWAAVGEIDALALSGRFDVFRSRVASLRSSSEILRFSPQQRAGVNWVDAQMLLREGRIQSSIDHLVEVVSCKEFQHRRDAMLMLVMVHEQRGDSGDAQKWLNRFVSEFKPGSVEISWIDEQRVRLRPVNLGDL